MPRDVDLVAPLAQAAMRLGKPQLAGQLIKGFDKKHSVHADIPKVYLIGAQLMAEWGGKPDEARRILQYLLKRYPSDSIAAEAGRYLQVLERARSYSGPQRVRSWVSRSSSISDGGPDNAPRERGAPVAPRIVIGGCCVGARPPKVAGDGKCVDSRRLTSSAGCRNPWREYVVKSPSRQSAIWRLYRFFSVSLANRPSSTRSAAASSRVATSRRASRNCSSTGSAASTCG